jgi:hypothetical protein
MLRRVLLGKAGFGGVLDVLARQRFRRTRLLRSNVGTYVFSVGKGINVFVKKNWKTTTVP